MLLVIHFLHPGFLFGLFLLAIPILLHLFNLKKYKKVYFSNFNFLLSLQQEKKNSSQLKKLLLLLCRLLAITAIVFAFACPFISKEKDRQHDQKKNEIMIYIDNSFSMSNTGSKGSLLDEAKKHFYDIVESYPAGTNFIFLSNDNVTHSPLTKEEVLMSLGGIKTTPAAKTLSEIYKEARSIAENQKITLFLLSDFQKMNCDFQSMPSDTLISPVFLMLQPENKNNLYIKDITFSQVFHRKNQNDKISVQVVNSSEKEFNNVPISLTINGKKKNFLKINIPANDEVIVDMNYQNTEDGFYQGYVEISDYPILFDNKFYFSYHVDNKVNVLCIEESKHCPYFQKLFSDSTAFDIKYINVNQTANTNFKNYNLIILDRISTGWTGLESILENYVQEGGNLFILPGEQTNVINNLLQKMHAPVLGAMERNTTITRIEKEAALFKDVFEKQEENSVLPRAKSFYKLDKTDNTEVLLEDQQGNALLISRQFGNGNVYLSAFDYDPENSDMVYHPVFVPLMVNMACNINSIQNAYWILRSKNNLMINSNEITDDANIHIVNEDRTLEFIPRIRKDFNGNFILTNTENFNTAGLYEVSANDQLIDVIACNYNRMESQLHFCEEAELQKHFPSARVENIKTTQIYQNSELIKNIVLHDNNKYLSRWFILLAVIALLLEQFIWRRKLN